MPITPEVTLPAFVEPDHNPDEPGTLDGNDPEQGTTGPRVKVGSDLVDVVVQAPAPALENLPRHESSFLKTMTASLGRQSPEPDLLRSYSRAVADPATALAKVSGPWDWTGTVHGPVMSVKADLLTCATLPGPQPRGRTGRSYRSASEPVVDHTDTGQIRLTFESVDHLVLWLTESIARTAARGIKRGRHLEIAATGIRREVAGHLAILSFRDGTADQAVVLVRDGITRWTCAHVLRLGLHSKSPEAAAKAIVADLIPTAKLAGTTDGRALSKHLHDRAKKVQGEYEDNLVAGRQNERAFLLRQSTRMPAITHLALAEGTTGMAAALDRIVADVHTDVEAWEDEDADFHNVRAVLEAMHEAGSLPRGLYDLVTAPDALTPLRRAVTLAEYAMGTGYVPVKTEMRRQGLHKAVQAHRVSALFGPVLTEPWSVVKGVGNVWGYSGALPVLKRQVALRHPGDYLDLVGPALNGDGDARDELRLAGGIALIANGVVTTSLIGGAGGSKGTSKRMALTTLFDRLCKSEVGLTQLAVAANTFDPTAAKNPVPAVDLARSDRVKRDNVGAPVGPNSGPGITGQDLMALVGPGPDEDDDPGPGPDPQADLEESLSELDASTAALTGLVTNIQRLRVEAAAKNPVIATDKSASLVHQLFLLTQEIPTLANPLVES